MDCHLMVGDKVVCVNNAVQSYAPGYGSEILPVVGESYTVREVCFDLLHQLPCIRLVEITNKTYPYRGGSRESWYAYWRFRRVVDSTETVAEMAAIVRREFEPKPSKKEAVK